MEIVKEFVLTFLLLSSAFWAARWAAKSSRGCDRLINVSASLLALLFAQAVFRHSMAEAGLSNDQRTELWLGLLVVGVASFINWLFGRFNQEADQRKARPKGDSGE